MTDNAILDYALALYEARAKHPPPMTFEMCMLEAIRVITGERSILEGHHTIEATAQNVIGKLRKMRLMHGISQEAMAIEIGCRTPSTVSQYESGNRTVKIDTLEKMVNALGYDLVFQMRRRTEDGDG